jgi:GTPase SAR1 family protein
LINSKSIEKLESKFRIEIHQYWPDAVVILVGCKSDLRDQVEQGTLQISNPPVDTESVKLLAQRLKCLFYIETSAVSVDGLNYNEFLEMMVQSHIYHSHFNVTANKKSKKCIIS